MVSQIYQIYPKFSKKIKFSVTQRPSRVYGNRGNNVIYFRGTRLKMKGTGEQMSFWGAGYTKN